MRRRRFNKKYHACLISFMSFKDGCSYSKSKRFSDAELLRASGKNFGDFIESIAYDEEDEEEGIMDEEEEEMLRTPKV